ncbi:MAG: dihydropyrimidinase [Proteobacteria bacterium]|nr:dihydropyrimidinase [Pseudomonadota bacterium]
MPEFDLVVRGGTVVTAADVVRCDVGVRAERVAAFGERLAGGAREIDAGGLLVFPGGVDSHVHVEQRGNASGPGTDTFLSATTSAACGGTTSILCFARQVKGETVRESVVDYHRRAKASVIDYGFHLTVTDATDTVLAEELPQLIRDGHRSLKFFMTTERSHLDDTSILKVLALARAEGAFVAVHAESFAATEWLTRRLLESGHSEVKYNACAKPITIEREAIQRVISYAELLDVPLQIFHVSGAEAAAEIERAQRRGLKVFGETCPQYLVFTAADLDRPVEEAVRYVFGPPARTRADHEALWGHLRRGVLNVVSSDHAPHAYGDPGGKLAGARKRGFATTPHGVPGLETRLPLLFSEGVAKGRIDLNTFVSLVAANPAKLFGLYPKKGTLAVGSDADLVVWDPKREVRIGNAGLHHRVDYTPYEGMTVTGWPVVTVSRGEVIYENGRALGREGRGRWLPRGPYDAIRPRGRFPIPFDPVAGRIVGG